MQELQNGRTYLENLRADHSTPYQPLSHPGKKQKALWLEHAIVELVDIYTPLTSRPYACVAAILSACGALPTYNPSALKTLYRRARLTKGQQFGANQQK